jgi:dipeptidyl aminopeptidase/acylaminoacyl peptidase
MLRTTWFFAVALLLGTWAGAQEQEQEIPPKPKPIVLPEHLLAEKAEHAMFSARQFQQAEISPDGRHAAWVESLPGKNGGPSPHSAIFVADLKAAVAPRRLAAGTGTGAHMEHDFAWSADGKRLAFLSDAAKAGQLQLYVADVAGGASRRLTAFKGFLSSPAWSPDGKTVAVLYTENAPRSAGPLVAETPDEGVVGEKVYEQRLCLVDAATGKVRAETPSDMYVYEYDWSPDGRELVVSAAHGAGDDNWYVAELYIVSAPSGAVRRILKPTTQIGSPHWSPDGHTIAFIGGLMSDEPIVGGDVYVLPSAGGSARNVTPGIQATAASLHWLSDSQRILFAEYVDGGSGVATVDVSSEKIGTLWTGAETISPGIFGASVSVARDDQSSVVVRQSFAHAPEVWAGLIGQWKQITKRNASLEPAWGEAKSLHWTSDGKTVQGWLIYPSDFQAGKQYSMVVDVHGGPAWNATPIWPQPHDYAAALPGAGYFVLLPNPRGSYGQGEDFTRANVKDFGYGDFRDIMAGVDAAVKAAPIDEQRIGITGWSYGGYMTMWAVTQTNRFHAAVAGAGLSNWQSYYGENGIDQWMIPYFGASIYDDPKVYAKSSPINFIKKAKTPTLVLVGDSDGECPPPQSYEFWHALKTLGVTTQFVIYPHEGHLFADPTHSQDVIERTIGWFNDQMPH